MFEFIQECELFGVEVKVSRKNNTYTVITVLSSNGKTVDVMYTGDSIDLTKLVSRKSYNFHFRIELGKYQKFTITAIDGINANE